MYIMYMILHTSDIWFYENEILYELTYVCVYIISYTCYADCLKRPLPRFAVSVSRHGVRVRSQGGQGGGQPPATHVEVDDGGEFSKHLGKIMGVTHGM